MTRFLLLHCKFMLDEVRWKERFINCQKQEKPSCSLSKVVRENEEEVNGLAFCFWKKLENKKGSSL